MPQTEDAKSDKQRKNKKFFPGGFWWIVLGAATLSGVAVYLSRAFSKETEQYTFIAQAILNILIFAAILVQALIYRRQWQVMEWQSEFAAKQIELMALSECAYVTIADSWKVDEDSWNNNVLVVHGQIHNGGRTPALNFKRKIQIAIGDGEPPPGWGRFDWDSRPDDSESIVLVSGGKVNCSTPRMKLSDKMQNDLVLGKQMVVIDGQCRYLDILGGEQVYTFGLAIDWMTSRALIRYQDYRREKANPENPN